LQKFHLYSTQNAKTKGKTSKERKYVIDFFFLADLRHPSFVLFAHPFQPGLGKAFMQTELPDSCDLDPRSLLALDSTEYPSESMAGL